MALRNLTAVARDYLDAGTARLVLAGVIESRPERDAYRAAVAVPLTVCRLTTTSLRATAEAVLAAAGW